MRTVQLRAGSRRGVTGMQLYILLLLLGGLCVPPGRAASHSLRYFRSVLSERLSWVPRFTINGYVDDEAIATYSSESRICEPRTPWLGQAAESGQQNWKWQTTRTRGWEMVERANLKAMMGRLNQTAGLHIVQVMYGCELREDGSIGGFYQYAYDGQDFLSFDKENMKYTASMKAGIVTADLWNEDKGEVQGKKAYLEYTCIERLQKYLNYGIEKLERRVPPQTMISRKKIDSTTTLTCYAYGFYPREIEVKWVRNLVEVEWKTKTILPNTDGTYQIRTTVELPEGHDEKEYRCMVDHIGLEEIITKVYEEEPGTLHVLYICGAISSVVGVLAVVIAAVFWKSKHPDTGNCK